MARSRLAVAALSACVGALLGGAGVLAVTAAPASAASNQPSSPPASGPPFISINKPASNDVDNTGTPTVSGTITTGDPNGQVSFPQAHLTSGDGHTTTTFPVTLQRTGQQGQWNFSGKPSQALLWNGPYQVVATATEDDSGQSRTGTSNSVNFSEGAPPQPPTGVSAAKDADGSGATVSWQANPESDIVGYQVQRASVNGSDWSTVTAGNGGTDTNFRDSSVQSGSDYQYRVIAVRSGAQHGQTIASSPSASASTVTPPISSLFGPGGFIGQLPLAIQAITDPVAGQVHPGPGPGKPVTGSPTAGGYGNLPYGGQAALSEPGTPGAQDPKGRPGANIIRTALFVAAGLILLAIAAHLIRMRRALDDSLAPVGVEQWDRHAAGADETAEVTTVGTDRRGSDVTRATAAQRGADDRSAITRAMAAQRRR